MSYFKINNKDYSKCVNELKVNRSVNYNSQVNAAGNTVVDYINAKRTIDVGIIPLDSAAMSDLLTAINGFNVVIEFRNPLNNSLETINCIIPEEEVEYYTIQAANNTSYKAFSLSFIEL